jgi:hypothetical protein
VWERRVRRDQPRRLPQTRTQAVMLAGKLALDQASVRPPPEDDES